MLLSIFTDIRVCHYLVILNLLNYLLFVLLFLDLISFKFTDHTIKISSARNIFFLIFILQALIRLQFVVALTMYQSP